MWRKRQIKVASALSCFKIRPLAAVSALPPIVSFIAPLCRASCAAPPEAAANRWRSSAQTHTHLCNPLAERRLPLDWQPRLMTCICPEPSVGPIHSLSSAHFPLPPAKRPGRTLVSLQQQDIDPVFQRYFPKCRSSFDRGKVHPGAGCAKTPRKWVQGAAVDKNGGPHLECESQAHWGVWVSHQEVDVAVGKSKKGKGHKLGIWFV